MKQFLIAATVILCTSISSFAAFDHTVTGIIDSTFLLQSESLLVDGGWIKEIVAKGNSYVEIEDTMILEPHIGAMERIGLWDSSSLNLKNGRIGAIGFTSSGTANISGGIIQTSLNCSGNGIVNVSGGYIELLYVNGSDITLTGGDINTVTMGLNVSSSASITFVCDLESLTRTYNNQGLLVGVTGKWLDGSSFDIDVENRGYNPTSDYMYFVPEPMSLALLGLGGLLMRRKKA